MKTRKSWAEKMNNPSLPKIEQAPAKWGGKTMAIPSPRQVWEEVEKLSPGEVIEISELRERLATKNRAEIACPLTTGIFLRICAEASEEQGNKLPYWRVVGNKGLINPKLPGGAATQAERLRAEGVAVLEKNGKYYASLNQA